MSLINLVTLGVSGVCIFAIFWAGWLLLRLPADATVEKQKSIRLHLVVYTAIAVVSSATGLMNTKINAEDIIKLEARHQELTDR